MAKPKTNQKKTRRLPELSYTIHRFTDYQSITDRKQTKAFIFMNMIRAVTEGIESNKDTVDMFKLGGSNARVMLERKSWKKSLTSALSFFTEIENYETCQTCKDLIDKI